MSNILALNIVIFAWIPGSTRKFPHCFVLSPRRTGRDRRTRTTHSTWTGIGRFWKILDRRWPPNCARRTCTDACNGSGVITTLRASLLRCVCDISCVVWHLNELCQSSVKFSNVTNWDSKNKPSAVIPVTFLMTVVFLGFGKRKIFVLKWTFCTHPSSFSSNDSAVLQRNAKYLRRVNVGSESLICSQFCF